MREQTGNEHFLGAVRPCGSFSGCPRRNLEARDSSRLAKDDNRSESRNNVQKVGDAGISIFELEIGMTEKADEVSHK